MADPDVLDAAETVSMRAAEGHDAAHATRAPSQAIDHPQQTPEIPSLALRPRSCLAGCSRALRCVDLESHGDHQQEGINQESAYAKGHARAAACARRVRPSVRAHDQRGAGREDPIPMATRLTFDTGALLALERNRKGMAEVVEAVREDGHSIAVPANAIAEWWRGRTDRRDYVRRMFVVREVDEDIAKLAGEALAWLKRQRVDVDDRVTVDATVIATAAIHGPNLYTGDFGDMQRFHGFFPTVKLFGLQLRA